VSSCLRGFSLSPPRLQDTKKKNVILPWCLGVFVVFFFRSAWEVEFSQDGDEVFTEVLDVLLRNFEDPPHLDLAVLMHDEISEAHSFHHFFGEISVQVTAFFQQIEHLARAARDPESFLTDNVGGDIDTALHSKLYVENDALLTVHVLEEALESGIALLMDTVELLLQGAGFGEYEIAVNQSETPP
jgi:hypothetical protein